MLNNGANLFSPLDNIQIGTTMYITDLTKVYQYKVTFKKVVNPYATELIDDVPGKKLLTLITCADGGVNRLAVQGKLIATTKATKTNLVVFNK
jgi:sortase A